MYGVDSVYINGVGDNVSRLMCKEGSMSYIYSTRIKKSLKPVETKGKRPQSTYIMYSFVMSHMQ